MSASEETLRRLRSARGHLDAVVRMVEDDRYCIDVLHQIRAVQGALDRSRRALLVAHLRTCVADAYATGGYDPVVTELLDALLGSGSPRTRTQDADRCAAAAVTAAAPAPGGS
jgi:CsoR family transcriptional regulator, copper-sensing transcriptional repressor